MRHTIKLIAILLTVFSLPNTAFAQTQQRNDSVFEILKGYMNSNNADSVYAMLDANFKAKYTKDAFISVLVKNIFPLGRIKESSFVRFNSGATKYKVVHEKATLQYILSTDDKGKLQALVFQPYKDPAATPKKNYTVPTSNPLESILDNRVDSIVRPYIQQMSTAGLSIGLLKNGKTTYYGYGETERGKGILPRGNTVFEIGSITKTFTATLLALYVNRGKVKLTDPVTKYLPDSVASNKELQGITLQMLINHTSGLTSVPDNLFAEGTDKNNPYKDYNKANMFQYLKNCKPESAPGEKYSYSNLAAGLLGIILEQVSGMTYDEMVKKEVCTPLHMENTGQYLSKSQEANFTRVYDEKGAQVKAFDFGAVAAAGCIRSCSDDLLQYARANMSNENVTLFKAMELTHKITYDKGLSVGLGWHYDSCKFGSFIWHNGATYGSHSYLAFDKERKVAVVVLSNCAISVDDIGKELLMVLENQ